MLADGPRRSATEHSLCLAHGGAPLSWCLVHGCDCNNPQGFCQLFRSGCLGFKFLPSLPALPPPHLPHKIHRGTAWVIKFPGSWSSLCGLCCVGVSPRSSHGAAPLRPSSRSCHDGSYGSLRWTKEEVTMASQDNHSGPHRAIRTRTQSH